MIRGAFVGVLVFLAPALAEAQGRGQLFAAVVDQEGAPVTGLGRL